MIEESGGGQKFLVAGRAAEDRSFVSSMFRGGICVSFWSSTGRFGLCAEAFIFVSKGSIDFRLIFQKNPDRGTT